jgi:SAM-dependent methyltransferase
MVLLIPGRHHLITQFQFEYLQNLCVAGRHKDVDGRELTMEQPEAIIFAITSANHTNTRRNPLPFYLRAIAIEAMSRELNVPVYIFGINDVGTVDDFASYTLKTIKHESDGLFDCKPSNTFIVCSTPVLELYESLGFRILPAELTKRTNWQHHTYMPWDIVEQISLNAGWQNNTAITSLIHHASYTVWKKYRLGQKVQILFQDEMISSDGDLTETRDYNVYVRQMDDIAELKFTDTIQYVQPGRIGDIGCAVGSWIKLACKENRLLESDFYGIEVSRHLFEICKQRKENKEFENHHVFFSQKNAVTGLVFEPGSMNTIHTSSLTHEIESYGGREDLKKFIQNRFDELVPGGVWINRDVVAPYNKEQQVFLWLNNTDGSNENPCKELNDRNALSIYLQNLSTYSRFIRFAKDFRREEGYRLRYSITTIGQEEFIELSMRDAIEFLSRKDYCDNWQSEMHETFCFWDFDEWKQELMQVGFHVHTSSYAFRNEWIVTNRWVDKVKIFNAEFESIDFPVTSMILVGVKQLK